jgi:mono/diheme cytochrome c family protein
MNDKIIKNVLATLLFMMTIVMVIQAQPWPVPDEYQKQAAPFKFDDNAKKAGEAAYMKNCKSCHGDPGKNNVAKIMPAPKDPVSRDYQNQTDGALFFKITNGRGPMPAFANILKEEERWQVIAYIRSFNPEYIQPPLQSAAEASRGRNVKIAMTYDSSRKIVIFKVRGLNEEKQVINMANVKLNLFVKRYFGNLVIGEAKTNENGIAAIKFPTDVPGDTSGYVQLLAMISDASIGEIQKDTFMKIGAPAIHKNILDSRSMWNIRSRAPWWVILSYTGMVTLVWGTIFFIIFEIRKIRLYNSTEKNS